MARKREDADEERDETSDRDGDEERERGEADDDEASDGDERKGAGRRADDDDAEPGDDEGEAQSDAERDASAAGVARALGVDEDEQAEEDADAPKNRALRRREEVEKRRKKRGEVELPRDKNKRAKELLARRRREAAEEAEEGDRRGLTAGEIVDDNLSRAASGLGKWVRSHLSLVQWVLAGGLVVAAGVVYYLHSEEEQSGAISSVLSKGLKADLARVVKEDPRTDEEKKKSVERIFTSAAERRETALAAYNEVVDQHPGTGPALLAKLGQGGIHLEQRNWAAAQTAFEEVASSTLAGADDDVRANAIEGIAFALEGKGELDAAAAKYKELEGIKGFESLGKYHQARILLAKGEKTQAKEMLLALRAEIAKPALDGVNVDQYLTSSVDETLREIDPAAVPRPKALGGPKGASMTDEEIQQLLERARKQAEEKGQHGEGEPGMPPGMPPGVPLDLPAPGGPPGPGSPPAGDPHADQ